MAPGRWSARRSRWSRTLTAAGRRVVQALLLEPEQEGAWAPPRVLAAQLHDPGFDARGHLMRTRQRLRRLVGQPGQPAGRVPAQPAMHRLAGHPVAAGHVGHGGPVVEHLQHCLIALFHQSQLHEHGRPPSHLWARTTTAKKVATGGWWTLLRARSVVQVPEPPSPRYRSRVREVSGRYRSHSVQHVPGPHTRDGKRCCGQVMTNRGQMALSGPTAPPLNCTFVVSERGLELSLQEYQRVRLGPSHDV